MLNVKGTQLILFTIESKTKSALGNLQDFFFQPGFDKYVVWWGAMTFQGM